MKRLFALLISLVMTVNMLPLRVFAEETNVIEDNEIIRQIIDSDNSVPAVEAATEREEKTKITDIQQSAETESKTEEEIAGSTTGMVSKDGYDEVNPEGNYVFWADSEEKAQIMIENIGGVLVSYNNGIATVYIDDECLYEEDDIQEFSLEGEETLKLYHNYIYTVEMEEESGEESDNFHQWHREYLKVDESWELTTGKGVKVAIIDTGIDIDHPALAANVVLAETVIPDTAYGSGGFFLIYKGPQDVLGHGTHVAGIIAANTEDKTVMGIAPECSIYSFKALEKVGNRGTGYTSWIAAAVLEAVENGADIINMSVGGSRKKDQFISEAIEIAVNSGCVVVCAAGNWNGVGSQEGLDYPAADPYSLAVTGAKQTETGVEIDLTYSRYGQGTDFIAPGTNIYSTVVDGYGVKNGTSMACPMVSGTVALVTRLMKDATDQEIIDIIKNTVIDLGEEGEDIYNGTGMVQVLDAVKKAQEATAPVPTPEPTEKPKKKKKKPRPVVAEAETLPVSTPEAVQTVNPITTPESEKTEEIQQLKEKLENLPAEQEQKYTTQDEAENKVHPQEKNRGYIYIVLGIVLFLTVIYIHQRGQKNEKI